MLLGLHVLPKFCIFIHPILGDWPEQPEGLLLAPQCVYAVLRVLWQHIHK
jgi:hypothetical protein